MVELKPCPFCGGEVELVHDADMEHYVIECENHGWESLCKTPDMVAGDILMVSYRDTDESKRALIEAWNTRWERTCRIEEVDLDENPVGGTVFGDGFCSHCWGIVEVEDKFCRHCGARMEADRGW